MSIIIHTTVHCGPADNSATLGNNYFYLTKPGRKTARETGGNDPPSRC